MDANSGIAAIESSSQFLTADDSPERLLARAIALCLILLFAVFGVRGIRWVMLRIYRPLARFTPEWLKILLRGFDRPVLLFCRFFFLFIAFFLLPVPDTWPGYAGKGLITAFYLLTGWGFWRSSELCSLLLHSAQNRLDLRSNRTLVEFFVKIYRAIVVILTIISIMDSFGLPVTGLLTGAGIVGVAISLAAQSTLSNLLAGVMLVLEHPFGLGDYIVVGSVEGFVETISFRSIRIRTADHELVTMENSAVSSAAIYNLSNRKSRKWEFTLGVTYDTSRQTLEALCPALQAAIEADKGVCPGETEVWVSGFGASSIDIGVRCYVTTTDLASLHALQTRVHCSILDVVQKAGCSFAFPSTSVYFENTLTNAEK